MAEDVTHGGAAAHLSVYEGDGATPAARRARRVSVRRDLARLGFVVSGCALVGLVLLLPARLFAGPLARAGVEGFTVRTGVALVLALVAFAAAVQAWRITAANAHRLDRAGRVAGRLPMLLAAPVAVLAFAIAWTSLR